MRYITSMLFALLFLSVPFSFASAHMSSSGGYMMGSDSWNENMMQFEDALVENDDVHEQMEQYMEALLDGELTDEQETQVLEWMRSDQYQPAMMSMMMRGLIGNSLEAGQNNTTWSSTGMMGSWGYDGFWTFGGWITMILVWSFLILGVATFWKSLNSTKK